MAEFDDILNRVERRIGAAMETIRARLREILSRLPEQDGVLPYDAQTVADLERTMRSLRFEMERAGLGDLMHDLQDDIAEIVDNIKEDMAEFGLPRQFSGATQRMIRAVMGDALDSITGRFGAGAKQIERFLSGAMLGGVRRSDLILDVQRALETTLHQAKTAASTALASAHRQITVSHGKENGVEWWVYFGPKDGQTREWCYHAVDHRGTVEQWEAIWDKWNRPSAAKGLERPVMVHGGGWNCRHEFVPVSGEDLKKYKPLKGFK